MPIVFQLCILLVWKLKRLKIANGFRPLVATEDQIHQKGQKGEIV
jgi:hypothetical protein